MKESTFYKIWDKVILPTYDSLLTTHGKLCLPDCTAEEIRKNYNEIIAYAKEHYMMDENGVLNRHKVASAMMIAILKVKPIKKIDPIYYKPDENGHLLTWPFNEHLAITVALSLLCTFIYARVDYAFCGKPVSRAIFEDVCEEDRDIFASGVPITAKERDDWERELYQIRQDGAYNLLSFAHILNGIEERSRLKYFLKHPEIKPTHSNYLTDEHVEMLLAQDLY